MCMYNKLFINVHQALEPITNLTRTGGYSKLKHVVKYGTVPLNNRFLEHQRHLHNHVHDEVSCRKDYIDGNYRNKCQITIYYFVNYCIYYKFIHSDSWEGVETFDLAW